MCPRLTIALFAVFIVAGCGDNNPVQPSQAESAADESASRSTAGIPAAVGRPERNTLTDGTRVGGNTAADLQDPTARLLTEIQQLRIRASTGSVTDSNRTIANKATEILRLTMRDASRQEEFLDGIRHLLQARLELALTGSATDVDQLYADVQALNDRDPEALAAAEGIYYLAKFAHTQARKSQQQKTEWNVSFSKWAREFGSRFSQQTERALSLLFGAGRSCEMTAATTESSEESKLLWQEARLCYVQLIENWPRETQGQEAAAVLRRLDLPGQQLSQFSGPDLNGGKVSAEQFSGRVTLIYFWDSASRDFSDHWLPLLQKADAKLSPNSIRLVGVNLDDEIDECRNAVRELKIPGDQICFEDDQQRGWDSPLVQFWGVSQSPSVWLVGHDGIVDAVDVRRPDLVTRINSLLKARTASRN